MNLFNKLVACLALTLCGTVALALQSDRSQPITIDADRAERDELAGTTTYSGNVEMAQGSMRINADEIIIYNTKDKVTKIVARGRPAAYEQKPNEKDGKVIAKASILEYLITQETLRLIEGASLQQEGTSLSGTTIEYDVRKSVVKAESKSNQNGRVRMVIPPKALRTDEQKAEPPKAPYPTTTPPNSAVNAAPNTTVNDKQEESAITGIDNGNP